MRRITTAIAVSLIAFSSMMFINTPVASASSACPGPNSVYDSQTIEVCLSNSTLPAENWGNGPYGTGVFHRHPAYGLYPAFCFLRTTKWFGVAGGGSTTYYHSFQVKEDLDGNCNGPLWDVPVESSMTLSFYSIYGVEETLNMGNGLSSSVWCGSAPSAGWTSQKYVASGGAVSATEADSQYGSSKCIPKTVGSDWKGGYYRATQRMKAGINGVTPYFDLTRYSDHHVCYPGVDC